MTMVTQNPAPSLVDMAKSGHALLGILVTIDIGGRYLGDTVVQDALGAVFGYDSAGRALHAPRPTSPAEALGRALYDLPRPKGHNIKVTRKPGAQGVCDYITIPYKNDDPDPRVSFRAWVETDQRGKTTVHVTGADRGRVLYDLERLVTKHLTLQSSGDIKDALTRSLLDGECRGTNWQRGSGVWFVPKDPELANFARLDQLREAVEGGFHNGSRIVFSGCYDEEIFRRDAVEILHADVLREVKELEEKIAEINDQRKRALALPSGAEKDRELKKLGNRLKAAEDALAAVGERAQTYDDWLSVAHQDVDAVLGKLGTQVRVMLGLEEAA